MRTKCLPRTLPDPICRLTANNRAQGPQVAVVLLSENGMSHTGAVHLAQLGYKPAAEPGCCPLPASLLPKASKCKGESINISTLTPGLSHTLMGAALEVSSPFNTEIREECPSSCAGLTSDPPVGTSPAGISTPQLSQPCSVAWGGGLSHAPCC